MPPLQIDRGGNIPDPLPGIAIIDLNQNPLLIVGCGCSCDCNDSEEDELLAQFYEDFRVLTRRSFCRGIAVMKKKF